jgi:uncharacterized damage-inducible protein DinB
MPKWPWIERKFDFDFPAGKFPDILERLRGTPARVAERIAGLDPAVLTRSDGKGLTIQENIGHVADVEDLFHRRVEEFMSGAAELTAADLSGKKVIAANHNAKSIDAIMDSLRTRRGKLIARLEGLKEEDWSRAAMHPRLKQPMRMVDHIFFAAEHDDYHMARITELIRALT